MMQSFIQYVKQGILIGRKMLKVTIIVISHVTCVVMVTFTYHVLDGHLSKSPSFTFLQVIYKVQACRKVILDFLYTIILHA